MTTSCHPTAKTIYAAPAFLATLVRVNGRNWHVQIGTYEDLALMGEDEIKEDLRSGALDAYSADRDIQVGEADDPESAIENCIHDLEGLIAKLRKHQAGLNDRVKAFEAKKRAAKRSAKGSK